MGPEREGLLRSPRGERDRCGPAKIHAVQKVHQFILDNNVFIEFHPFFYLINDNKTRHVLQKGTDVGYLRSTNIPTNWGGSMNDITRK